MTRSKGMGMNGKRRYTVKVELKCLKGTFPTFAKNPDDAKTCVLGMIEDILGQTIASLVKVTVYEDTE